MSLKANEPKLWEKVKDQQNLVAIVMWLMLSVWGFNMPISAQDISIDNFEAKPTDLKARVSPVYDKSGEACALIRFSTRDTTFIIEGNQGVLKRETLPGEILMYVPHGTKLLTIRRDNLYPLRDYEIPMRLEPMSVYDALLMYRDVSDNLDVYITRFERHSFLTQQAVLDKANVPCAKIRLSVPPNTKWKIDADKEIIEKTTSFDEISLFIPEGTQYLSMTCKGKLPIRNYTIPVPIVARGVYDAVIKVTDSPVIYKKEKSQFYLAAGFNFVNLTGPSLAFGIRHRQHLFELGGVWGLNKTKNFSEYSDLHAHFQYQLRRAQLRYGYSVMSVGPLDVAPIVGLTFNYFDGKVTEDMPDNRWDLMKAFSFSASAALRLEFSLIDHVKLQVTPEYNFNVKQNLDCGVLCWFDTTCKKWSSGFSMNSSLCYVF